MFEVGQKVRVENVYKFKTKKDIIGRIEDITPIRFLNVTIYKIKLNRDYTDEAGNTYGIVLCGKDELKEVGNVRV
jgi:hypothetical protein